MTNMPNKIFFDFVIIGFRYLSVAFIRVTVITTITTAMYLKIRLLESLILQSEFCRSMGRREPPLGGIDPLARVYGETQTGTRARGTLAAPKPDG